MKNNRWTWIGFFGLAVAALIFFLDRQFPGTLAREEAQMRAAYLGALLTLIGCSVMLGWQKQAGTLIRHMLLWTGIAMALGTGYVHRQGIMRVAAPAWKVAENNLATILPGGRTSTAPRYARPGTVALISNLNGHFHTKAIVNGKYIHFMVDTGASEVILTAEDAQQLGYDLDSLVYSVPYATANGKTYAAQIRLEKIQIASITVRDVEASIIPAGLAKSLLGMSFLGRLKQIELQGNRLTLHR